MADLPVVCSATLASQGPAISPVTTYCRLQLRLRCFREPLTAVRFTGPHVHVVSAASSPCLQQDQQDFPRSVPVYQLISQEGDS